MLVEENLRKSDLEKCTDAWTAFAEIRQRSEESAKDFVSSFEQVETSLRNVKIVLPKKALAVHLITRSNLSQTSKEKCEITFLIFRMNKHQLIEPEPE